MKTFTIRIARTYKMYATIAIEASSESLAYEMAENAVDEGDVHFEVDYYDETPPTYDIVDEVDHEENNTEQARWYDTSAELIRPL